MQNKRPPNAEATQFKTGEKQVKIAKMGGIASGKAKRYKKAARKILSDFLNSPIKDNVEFCKMAKAAGIDSDKTIKELVILACLLNAVKKGGIAELQTLANLLGEKPENNNVIDMLDDVLKGIDETMFNDIVNK